MKILFAFAVLLAFSASAVGYIPPVRSTTRNEIAGGTGTDYAEVGLLRAFEDYFTNGHYFLTFNVVRQELTNYRLPDMIINRKCEFHPEGGAVGNYRPKAVWANILLGEFNSGRILWGSGSFGTVENDNPVVKKFQVMGTILPLNVSNKQTLAAACSAGLGIRSMNMTWSSIGMCRWAREDWFKPGHFPIEYWLPDHPHLTRRIQLNCVNR